MTPTFSQCAYAINIWPIESLTPKMNLIRSLWKVRVFAASRIIKVSCKTYPELCFLLKVNILFRFLGYQNPVTNGSLGKRNMILTNSQKAGFPLANPSQISMHASEWMLLHSCLLSDAVCSFQCQSAFTANCAHHSGSEKFPSWSLQFLMAKLINYF